MRILANPFRMNWYQEDEYEDEEGDLMFSPALLARRASESWIIAPPVEVYTRFSSNSLHFFFLFCVCLKSRSSPTQKKKIEKTKQ